MMEPTSVKRKLAAILAADAGGCTRLTREAEEPTLQPLTDYCQITDGLVGRQIQTEWRKILAQNQKRTESSSSELANKCNYRW